MHVGLCIVHDFNILLLGVKTQQLRDLQDPRAKGWDNQGNPHLLILISPCRAAAVAAGTSSFTAVVAPAADAALPCCWPRGFKDIQVALPEAHTIAAA